MLVPSSHVRLCRVVCRMSGYNRDVLGQVRVTNNNGREESPMTRCERKSTRSSSILRGRADGSGSQDLYDSNRDGAM